MYTVLRAQIDQVGRHGVEDGVLQVVMVHGVGAGHRDGAGALGVAQAVQGLQPGVGAEQQRGAGGGVIRGP